jgi:BirA family biotin operon repressor/biotin-[acetyl-CoA-carboxylase] ligase
MKLDPRATAAGARLTAHDVLGSTNAEALALARCGERGPLWVVARRQTAGRGRRGRAWVSEPGNLFATLLLTAPGPAVQWPQLSFVAALAVHDAITRAAGGRAQRLTIKWPNDLLLDGAKVAGILVEGQGGAAARTDAVVVGIGVNCASHPRGIEFPATDLARLPCERLFTALSGAMAERLVQWDEGHAFAAVRADWLARAGGLGSTLRVRLSGREVSGRFDGIDAAGNLILRSDAGAVTIIAAGDVFIDAAGAPAPAA